MSRDISGCNYLPGTKMTQRGPETLSRHYGFESVQAAADALPSGARVLDAGAGASRFGHTLAGMRPDVRWVNLDTGYANQAATAALQATAPDNLTFREGDIVDAAELFSAGSFDRVFSYFALNYLREPQAAIGRLIEVAAPTGQLALGKLWIAEDHVAAPRTIRFAPGAFPGDAAAHVSKALDALNGGAPPLEGAEYFQIRGDDSIK